MKLRIELPWPDKALSPNGRVHWARKAKAAKKQREWACVAATAAMRSARWPKGLRDALTRVTFVVTQDRKRDRDNFAAMLKSAWDGCAEAGVIENDCGFTHAPPQFVKGKAKGVVIEIEPIHHARTG
jgi:crossover junction endodeoxyribonuclease RusA